MKRTKLLLEAGLLSALGLIGVASWYLARAENISYDHRIAQKQAERHFAERKAGVLEWMAHTKGLLESDYQITVEMPNFMWFWDEASRDNGLAYIRCILDEVVANDLDVSTAWFMPKRKFDAQLRAGVLVVTIPYSRWLKVLQPPTNSTRVKLWKALGLVP